MNIIYFAIAVLGFTAYEAWNIDKGVGIDAKNKQYSKLIRLALILLAAENPWQLPAYFLIVAGSWSILISYFSKSIQDTWYHGVTGPWGRFWLTMPGFLFQAYVILTILAGFGLLVWSYWLGGVPCYYQ